ncbi:MULTISPECIES: hypothetical protein [Geobacillus]|uniref:hypothetical protein n=1 Tax=Geobacillus TaxID=129337 RepID=UPI00038A4711|nr:MULTISPECIES: hypothetical protein [Geobacillus]EQB95472.1 hypothetical protein GA8_11565 [Geobacillus sp. A8]QNU21451.1 hypothetical protein IC805_19000 [Geobacillus thermoleovorans]QNU21519.1 hypothetical protein IC805_00395 [Geobacillus thermoleovorans]QNU25399.1 hypothetical protein IC806_03860 [Geobacillus zalihae]
MERKRAALFGAKPLFPRRSVGWLRAAAPKGDWWGQHRFALLWLVVAVTPTERYNSE